MKPRILIVDDEELLRGMLRDFFEGESMLVFEAENGRDAFKIVQNSEVDLVLSDVRMAGGDGIELAQNIHSMSGHRPKLILMSGSDDFSKDVVKNFGVFEVIRKPFSLESIGEKVDSVIFDVKK